MLQIPLDDEVARKFFHKDSLEIIIFFVFEAISSRGYETIKNERINGKEMTKENERKRRREEEKRRREIG